MSGKLDFTANRAEDGTVTIVAGEDAVKMFALGFAMIMSLAGGADEMRLAADLCALCGVPDQAKTVQELAAKLAALKTGDAL